MVVVVVVDGVLTVRDFEVRGAGMNGRREESEVEKEEVAGVTGGSAGDESAIL